jgi:hypothetical protein
MLTGDSNSHIQGPAPSGALNTAGTVAETAQTWTGQCKGLRLECFSYRAINKIPKSPSTTRPHTVLNCETNSQKTVTDNARPRPHRQWPPSPAPTGELRAFTMPITIRNHARARITSTTPSLESRIPPPACLPRVTELAEAAVRNELSRLPTETSMLYSPRRQESRSKFSPDTNRHQCKVSAPLSILRRYRDPRRRCLHLYQHQLLHRQSHTAQYQNPYRRQQSHCHLEPPL